jgi:hypothetical protein
MRITKNFFQGVLYAKKSQFIFAVFTVSVIVALSLTACDNGTSPKTDDPVTVNALNVTGMVTAPIKNTAPSTTAINHAQYTGTIAWQDENGGAVSGNFAASTVYRTVVTLAAKSGFTFDGVAANVFSHNGATSVTNAAGSGTVTITFPATAAEGEDTIINALDLTTFVIAPITGAVPSTAPIDHTQYTGTIAWQTSGGGAVSGNFAVSTVYKAVVTLTAKSGFTFTGIVANRFTHSGASSVTNAVNSGTVTITFPQTQTSGGQPTGNGTSSNPYRIYNKAGFMAIAGGVGTNGKYYRLEADLVGAESIT